MRAWWQYAYGERMSSNRRNVGAGVLLRQWRLDRRMSQLDLSLETGVSTRHMSCIETGKVLPSRQILLHLAEALDIPFRERNVLLLAGGFAPTYPETQLGVAASNAATAAFARIVAAHQPYPAIVLNRYWDVLIANAGVRLLLPPHAPAPAIQGNALRIALHPDGLAPHIGNFAEWSGYLMTRLRRQVTLTGDRALRELYREVATYPGVQAQGPRETVEAGSGVVVLQLTAPFGEL